MIIFAEIEINKCSSTFILPSFSRWNHYEGSIMITDSLFFKIQVLLSRNFPDFDFKILYNS